MLLYLVFKNTKTENQRSVDLSNCYKDTANLCKLLMSKRINSIQTNLRTLLRDVYTACDSNTRRSMGYS